MILLHTSDWHLGAADGDRSLLEDQQFFVDEICRIIAEEQVEAVLIAGDVYDRSVASAEAIRLYDQAMTRICKGLGVPVCIIAGNHDSAERLASCCELLSDVGLHVAGALTPAPQIVSFRDTQVFLLPWITEAKVKSVFPEAKDRIQSLEDACRVIVDRFRTAFDPRKKHVLMAHAFITDAETSTSDRAAEIGYAMQVPASVFAGFDYVALGHIHKPQDVSPTVRYSGTPMPYSFGKEEKQEKSVTLIDTKTMARKVVPLPLLHRRTTITGTREEALHPSCSEAARNGYVRVIVTDSYIGLETLSDLRQVYPNLLEASGKTFENESASVTMTMQELADMGDDPVAVFRCFCKEELDVSPDERLVGLFRQAVESSGEVPA